jgi:hypothetical protein
MTEEITTRLDTDAPCLIPLTETMPDAAPGPRADQYVLWGYARCRNASRLTFSPLYRIMAAPEGAPEFSQGPPHQPLKESLIQPLQPEASIAPLLSLSLPSSEQPALQRSNSDRIPVPDDPAQPQTGKMVIPRPPYSREITRCLKQAFIDTVGQDRKLTREQRREIMQETGLSSRSITYWFSNHKRRPPFFGKQYRQAVVQSRGQVKTFEDFELWAALSKK